MPLGQAYQIEWGPITRVDLRTSFIVFADGADDADTRAREVLSTKYPGKYSYTVLKVVRSGEFEVLPHSGE